MAHICNPIAKEKCTIDTILRCPHLNMLSINPNTKQITFSFDTYGDVLDIFFILNSNSSFMSNQMRSYDNYMVMFNEILHFSVIGIENVFTCKVDLVESNCIIKFYKRNDNSGKMIVFRYDGITIVDGSTENLIIKHVNAG